MSVEDVQRITHFDDLTPDARFDVRQPGDLDASAPEPCRALYDQQATFADGWTQFRSVQYSGAANKAVTQAVGVYPRPQDAQEAFGRLADALAKCTGLHDPAYDYTAKRIDPSTLQICFADDCRAAFGIRSTVLIAVTVQHFPRTSAQIGSEVVQAITDRITRT